MPLEGALRSAVHALTPLLYLRQNDDEFSARLQFPSFVPEVSHADEYANDFITDRLLPRLSTAAGATEVLARSAPVPVLACSVHDTARLCSALPSTIA